MVGVPYNMRDCVKGGSIRKLRTTDLDPGSKQGVVAPAGTDWISELMVVVRLYGVHHLTET